MVPEQIEHEVVIAAPPERVWALLTEAEHIREWFAFDGAEIDLRPGGALVMRWQEHGTYHARIEAVEPPHRFAYRWSHLPDREPEAGNATLVAFTLAPEGTGTRLRVVESDFRALALPEEEQAEAASANTQGWSGGLSALQDYALKVPA
jgi:uncharacterized protein YndB with AHSA1/START domain